MNKKLLIFVISALTLLTVAVGVIGIIIYNQYAPKDPNANYTDVIISEEVTTDPIKITEVYEFYNEFKAPEYKQGTFRDTVSSASLPYCIIEPRGYSPEKEYPVLLYLHSAGDRGRDNVSQVLAIQDAFLVNGDLLSNTIIVCPQTTSWWNAYPDKSGPVGAAVRLIEDLSKTYNMDKNRIYVIGVSMGGYGTWEALSHFPDVFAAGIPICGGGDPYFANTLADIPIWVYHGDADSTVPVENSDIMYNAIKTAGGNKIHYTRLKGVNHNCWTAARADRELFSWLFCQNKATNKTGDYTKATVFKILNQDGNTILDDSYAEEPFFHYYSNYVLTRFNLTDDGLNTLKSAYKSGGEFTLVHGNQKLFSFRSTDIEPNNKFEVDTKEVAND